MQAPLHGVRVLDLTEGMTGAVTSVLLADYGAEVIHIDAAPATVDTRTWDRGKRHLPVNLDDPADRAAFMDLADGADVVIVGLEPSQSARLGLDATSVTARNPDVVYVALTAFGLDDPGAIPAQEPLVAAELGAMLTVPAIHRHGPVFPGHPAIAYSTAFVAVIGILAGLRARVVNGRGDVLDVSMRDGVLGQFTMNWWSERRIASMDRRPDGELDLGTIRMVARRFRCADGRQIGVHTGANGAFGRLMKLVGLDDRVSPVTGPVESATPLTPGDLEVLEELHAIFATRDAQDWLDDIWANEIAALPVHAPGEVFDDAQVIHNGIVQTVDLPAGPTTVVGPPIRLSRSATAPPAPSERVHRDVQWASAGLEPGRGEPLALPLAGVRVVELATFFAAPYANRFLGDLGADVVKVEPVTGDPMRSLADTFATVAKGKRSLAVDLKAEATRPAIDALLAAADIVQHNFRPGVAERLAVDEVSVRRRNPEVIYDYAPGYGSTGPKSGLQSFAPLHSGFAGLHTEAAGEGNDPVACFGNEDYYNGQLNAIGQLLALIHRDRTGEGQYVECPQLSSAVFVTSHWHRDATGLHSCLPTLDHGQNGWGPYQRLYQCLEGWLCVCCLDEGHRSALVRSVTGATDGTPTAGLEDALVYEFFGRTADEWCATLREVGVPCAVARETSWLDEYLLDERNLAGGMATAFDHPTAGRVSIIGRFVRLASLPPGPPSVPPQLGQHSEVILGELGLDDSTRRELFGAGLVGGPIGEVAS